MERNISINKIKERIEQSDKGAIFTLSDFLDLASYVATKKALSRLTKSGELVRVLRGVYKKPNYNIFMQAEVPASADQIAQAIAKDKNWTIGPKGEAALNILGLSTQVPAIYEYITDGPNKKIDYDGITISFRKRSNKDISGNTYKTILIIEALRTLGSDSINDDIRRIIARKCTDIDIENLLEDGKNSTRWIFEEIKKIANIRGTIDE